MSRAEQIKVFLEEMNPEALLADGLEEALVGTTTGMHPIRGPIAVYDREKCLQIFMKDGMTEGQACEYMSFNVEGAYVGEGTPIFCDFSSFE